LVPNPQNLISEEQECNISKRKLGLIFFWEFAWLAWPGPGLGWPGSGLTLPGLNWLCLAWAWPDLACAWPCKVSECYHFVPLVDWTLPTILQSWPSASSFFNHTLAPVCVLAWCSQRLEVSSSSRTPGPQDPMTPGPQDPRPQDPGHQDPRFQDPPPQDPRPQDPQPHVLKFFKFSLGGFLKLLYMSKETMSHELISKETMSHELVSAVWFLYGH